MSLLDNTKVPFMKRKTQHISSMQSLYTQILITKKLHLNINNIGSNIKQTLEKALAMQIEGKCIVEGYIKPNSVEIITFSSGLLSGSNVTFEVVFQCYVCLPVEGMHINCIANHINKAGIRAEVKDKPSPVVIFIARDHNYSSPLFSQVKENDEIKIRVIGQRFELNDTYISIIAELVEKHGDVGHVKKTYKSNAPITIIAPTQTLAQPTLAPQTIAKKKTNQPTVAELPPITEVEIEYPPVPMVTAPVATVEPVQEPVTKKRKITVKKPLIKILN